MDMLQEQYKMIQSANVAAKSLAAKDRKTYVSYTHSTYCRCESVVLWMQADGKHKTAEGEVGDSQARVGDCRQ